MTANLGYVLILVAALGGIYLYWKRRKANAAVASSTSDVLKAHLQAVSAAVATSAAETKAHTNAMGTVLMTEIKKLAAVVAPSHAPAPAAPAPPAASGDPPASAVPAAPVASGPVAVAEWPHLITIDGINVMAKAPLNPAWKASSAGHIFGSQAGWVYDPSNGDKAVPPQPLRSAAAYPLKYALGAGGVVVGTPSVLYGDQSFNSDAEAETFIAKIGTGYEAALAARDEAAANQVYTGPVPVASLTLADKMYLDWLSHQPGKTNIAYQVLSGTALAIRQAINDVGNEPAMMQGYSPATYSGPLKQYG